MKNWPKIVHFVIIAGSVMAILSIVAILPSIFIGNDPIRMAARIDGLSSEREKQRYAVRCVEAVGPETVGDFYLQRPPETEGEQWLVAIACLHGDERLLPFVEEIWERTSQADPETSSSLERVTRNALKKHGVWEDHDR